MPSLFDAFKQYINDAKPGGLLNPEVPPGGPTELAKGLLGFTPIVGDAISGYDAIQSARQGNYGEAALNGLGLLPFVPALGGMTKSPYKGKKLPDLAYQIDHKPMTVSGGAATLHDVERVFGPDIWSKNALQYFGSGGFDRQEKAAIELMRKVKGNPDAMVTVYRGVPDGVSKINSGDWVALTPDIAAEYGNVLKMQVPAKHVTSWPDSLVEFGYFPD